ncbi:MAG: homoserine dehydrogenase [Planctomycetota bacterium]
MTPYRIALLGLGTVGTEVAHLVDAVNQRRSTHGGAPLAIVGIGVRDRSKPRRLPVGTDPRIVTTDLMSLATRPDVDLVVELIGGVDPAAVLIEAALGADKDVVTANKALLAERGEALFALAARRKRQLLCEAAVAGAVPILHVLRDSLPAGQVQRLTAILNGTSNYVLDQLGAGMLTAEAIDCARRAGFAEADPTLDLDGTDAAHKLALLARILTGRRVDFRRVARRGIVGLAHVDLAFGARRRWQLRLIARFENLSEGRAALGVYPAWVRDDTPFASVRNEQNAVLVCGQPFGTLFFSGKGAGGGPTASSVLADIFRAARGEGTVSQASGDLEIEDPEAVAARYSVRFEVPDRPGILGRIASTLGRHDVSIAAVEQPDTTPRAVAHVHLLTHSVARPRLDAALAEVALDPMFGPTSGVGSTQRDQPVCVRVEDAEGEGA